MESPTLTPQTFATAPTSMAPSGCPSCGAPLAVDQRYCLQCGERRGEPRVPLMRGGMERQIDAAAPQPVGERPARAPRGAAGTTLVAGVGTLLMALGVGVLIGHSADGGSQPAKAPPVQVVTVAGAAGAGTAGDTPAAGAADAMAKGGGKKHGSHAAKSKQGASDIVAPPSGKALPKKIGKVVKPGDKGHGPGYENGKFTGDFFGQ